MPIKGKHLIHYVPHGINSDEFCPLQHGDKLVNKLYKEYFGVGEYNFILGFNSRNSHRKHPSNLILAFKNFCDHLSTEQASKCALVMHTDKSTDQGTNLIAVVTALCPNYKVVVDESRKTPQEMCAFYNLCDVVANVSSNEGFGLSVAESIMCGTPVIANVTGVFKIRLARWMKMETHLNLI
jgi:glycosyltransferase involved in cell wall biosynthesis